MGPVSGTVGAKRKSNDSVVESLSLGFRPSSGRTCTVHESGPKPAVDGVIVGGQGGPADGRPVSELCKGMDRTQRRAALLRRFAPLIAKAQLQLRTAGDHAALGPDLCKKARVADLSGHMKVGVGVIDVTAGALKVQHEREAVLDAGPQMCKRNDGRERGKELNVRTFGPLNAANTKVQIRADDHTAVGPLRKKARVADLSGITDSDGSALKQRERNEFRRAIAAMEKTVEISNGSDSHPLLGAAFGSDQTAEYRRLNPNREIFEAATDLTLIPDSG